MKWRRRVSFLSAGLAAALAAWFLLRPRPDSLPDDPPIGPPWFVDVTDEVGLRFVHDAGSTFSAFFMPQALGSGAALFDADGDGKLDILLLHNGGPKGTRYQLFLQQKDGKFRDASLDSGLDVAGYGMGVAIGDIDNDGKPDVLITEYGGIRLFRNKGGGKFEEITKQAGLDNPAWGASAAFFDFDRDGWLDMVVVNYVDYDPTHECKSAQTGQLEYCPPKAFPGRVTRLFRNKGNGTFEDVTVAMGLGQQAGPGLGVLCADFNGDGWPDIFVANDGAPNRLWINQKGKGFREEAFSRGVAYNRVGQTEASMGVAWADVDGDGLFDLFVTHLAEETHTLWKQKPAGFFSDRTTTSDLLRSRWRGTGFGTVLADFDCDGAVDLAVVNGRIARGQENANPDLGTHWGWYAQRNQLWSGDGAGTFRDLSPSNPALCGTPNVARGLAWGDIDGDGALDLLVTTAGGPAKLYRNVAPNRGRWLMIRAFDPKRERDAYGAEVKVVAGKHTWVRQINPASSYLSSNDPRAHFGLGDVKHVDSITIRWPDGECETEEFEGVDTNQLIELHRGKRK
jgi:hypothetical protein